MTEAHLLYYWGYTLFITLFVWPIFSINLSKKFARGKPLYDIIHKITPKPIQPIMHFQKFNGT